jgi:hypothetical protein
MLLSFLLLTGTALAEPTEIVVHVLSKGSKFIGTSMGGALVTLEDALTGELLAHGYTEGGTGDTQLIMEEKHTTHTPVSTENAARFKAVLDIERPVLLRVTAQGPMTDADGNEASSTMWVVPGHHVTGGDAWRLELPGLVVQLLDPPNRARKSPGAVRIETSVVMGCGCPVVPDSLWDAKDYEITATLLKDGKTVAQKELAWTGEGTRYAADLEVAEPGTYRIRAVAYHPASGNTGLDRSTFTVR